MITISQWVPLGKLNQFDSLVRQMNGRYVVNPYQLDSKVRIQISFDDGLDYQNFSDSWNRMETNIIEVPTSMKKRWIRKVKKFFGFQ